MRSRAAIRYSKAVFQISEESDNLSGVKKDMDAIILANNSSPDFKQLLKNALINYSDKKKIISSLMINMNEVTNKLIGLLIANKRLSILNDVALSFNEIYNEKQNIAIATVITATPISDDIRTKALSKIKLLSDKSVEIKNIVDENILGGFILRFENTEYNASFSKRLMQLKTELIK